MLTRPLSMGWRQVKTDPESEAPPERGGAACVAIGDNSLLLFGGANRTSTSFNDWWLFSEHGEGGHWTKISPVVKLSKRRKLTARSGASLTFIPANKGDGGQVFVFGGQDPVSGVIFDDFLSLDVTTWELRDVPLAHQQPTQGAAKQQQRQQRQQAQRPPGRHSHVAGAFDASGVIVFGGAGLRGPLNDVWLFELASGQWRCLSSELAEEERPEAREMAAGTMISEAGLLIHGGRGADGSLLDDICIFDGRAARWVLIQATGYARCAHTACNAAALAAPAGSEGGGGGQAHAVAAGAGVAAPASNVLLFGGFTGDAVAADLLQLSFMRQQRSSGNVGLRAELRPVQAEGRFPPQRFAHAAAVLRGPDASDLVVVGGVNQSTDMIDVWCWTV